MADFAADHALGEDVQPEISQLDVVEYAATIAAGDFLEVSGIATPAADNMFTVIVHTGTVNAYAVAMFAGVSGDRKQVLIYGKVKVTFGAAVTVGALMTVSANQAINQAILGSGIVNGKIISNGAAAADTGLVFFVGASGGG